MSNRTIHIEPRKRPEMVSPAGPERWRQFFQHFVYLFEGLSDCYKVRLSYEKYLTIIGTSRAPQSAGQLLNLVCDGTFGRVCQNVEQLRLLFEGAMGFGCHLRRTSII